MATITTDTYLDGGTARSAGEAMAIGNGAKFTVRTDTRIHANAPASFTGSLSSPTFTDIGGEFYIDATAVRWLAYNSGSGVTPSIGTSITQGAVSGYYLGCWSSIGSAPVAVGAAVPATGFIKLREVTGGTYSAGALGGISASATGADVPGWIECVWDAATNFVVGRVGSFKSRGGWFQIGTTNGSVGQALTIPTSSSSLTNIFCPGVYVETAQNSGVYEFWPGLASAANMWIRTSLGFAEGYTDTRGKFVKTFAGGQVIFGETATLSATYASLAAQASSYAAHTVSGTYTWAGNVITVNTGTTAHLLDTGQQVGLDFSSGDGADALFTVTVVDAYNFTATYAGSGAGGSVTVRIGVTVTFTAHGLNQGESVYCDFTSGGGVDGTYTIYSVDSANAYKLSVPTTAAIASGNVSCLHTLVITYASHGHAIGNEVYCDFTSGGATDGRYIMKAVAANTININYPHSAVISTSNVTLRWTIGYVPPANCRVRIPNIVMAECATGSRATNSVPNATIASRPEFATTTAGAIDLESIYALSMRSIFAQAYSIRLYNCAFQESLDISECATALDIDTVGVGMYSAVDARAFTLVSNFAGGTVKNVWAHRATIGTSDHCFGTDFCNGITFENINIGVIGYARSTGIAYSCTGSQSLTFNGLRVFNGNIAISTSARITINNLDYNDRHIGHTSPTTPYYAVTVSAGCDQILINGITCGMNGTVEDCHPYTGFLLSTAATNIRLRNVGSSAAYVKTGVWAPNYAGCGIVFVSGGNNNTVKVQRVFVERMRTGLFTEVNSDKNILYEQFLSSYPWLHSAKGVYTSTPVALNKKTKGVKTGAYLASGQTSVYGSHWADLFQGNGFGAVLLMMNEPTAETVAYYSNVSGVVKFNSSGGVEMRAIGAQSIWEMNYFAQGHTGFANITPVMSGGTIGNYTLEYQIDKGSGWNGTWQTLDAATLSAESGISATTGFKLKIRITTSSTNTTAITFLRIYTTTTTSAQNAVAYPLDTATVTISGLVTGSRVKFVRVSDSSILAIASESSGAASLVTDYVGDIRIEARKASSDPYYKPFVTQVTSIAGATVTAIALQQLDS